MRNSPILLVLGLTLVAAPITAYLYLRRVHEQDVQGISALRDRLESVRAELASATTAADSAGLLREIREREYFLGRRQFHVPLREAQLAGWWRPTSIGTLAVAFGGVLWVVGLFRLWRAKTGVGRSRSLWTSLLLAVRSLLWTALLPGLVAGYVPWRFFGLNQLRLDTSSPRNLVGVLGIGLGTALLGTCIWEFARTGRGTLAPVDPPRQLVVRGLYQYVRNPMYISVTTIVLSEALVMGSWALLLYWAIWFLVVNLLVIGYEEPTLRRRFGTTYEAYAQRAGRWLPRFKSGPSNPVG